MLTVPVYKQIYSLAGWMSNAKAPPRAIKALLRESPELAAIAARLSRLSDQVGDLRQLVTVKDQQIAALQAQLAERDAMGSIDSREVGEAGVACTPCLLPQSPQDCRGGSLPWVAWSWYLWAVSFMPGGDRVGPWPRLLTLPG